MSRKIATPTELISAGVWRVSSRLWLHSSPAVARPWTYFCPWRTTPVGPWAGACGQRGSILTRSAGAQHQVTRCSTSPFNGGLCFLQLAFCLFPSSSWSTVIGFPLSNFISLLRNPQLPWTFFRSQLSSVAYESIPMTPSLMYLGQTCSLPRFSQAGPHPQLFPFYGLDLLAKLGQGYMVSVCSRDCRGWRAESLGRPFWWGDTWAESWRIRCPPAWQWEVRARREGHFK